MTEKHVIAVSGGRYVCLADNCDFDTLNRWTAENHYVEHSDDDVDIDELDAPNWLING